MPGNGAVGGLELHNAVGGHQNGGHHGKAPEGGGHHVAHHVTVIVLQRPDEAAFRAYNPRHRVVNQGVKIGQA